MVVSMIPLSAFSVFAEAAADMTATIDTGEQVTLADTDANGYYEISNADELYAFAALVNGGNTSINGEITADIVVNEDPVAPGMTNAREWIPIGYTKALSYKGSINGNGHRIHGLYYDKETSGSDYTFEGLGFVGCLGSGSVRYLNTEDTYFSGESYVGGMVGYNSGGTIESCNLYLNYDRQMMSITGKDYVGGLAGYSFGGHIDRCKSYNNVTGNNYVGGLLGYYNDSDGRIEGGGADSETKVVGNKYVGGFAGYTEDGRAIIFDFASDVCGISYVGGVVGYNNKGVFSGCLSIDPVVTGNYMVGGFVGYNKEGYVEESIEGVKVNIYPCEYENGFCKYCENYMPADLNSDGVYEIRNAGQLYWFSEKVNYDETFESADAILTADIVVNEGEMSAETTDAREWLPIGHNLIYCGTFDGQNHTISGLYINNTDAESVGLFGFLDSGAVVKNTGIINSYFCAEIVAGAIAGVVEEGGRVFNCYNTSTIKVEDAAGGIVGANYNGAINHCYNRGTVEGYSEIGGIVGLNMEGIVGNCYNAARIVGLYENSTGALIGESYIGKVVNNYYLFGTCSYGIGGDSNSRSSVKTLNEFKSGEVANLLGEPFGQKIGEENFPVLGGDTVYAIRNCQNNIIYSNNTVIHRFEGSTCLDCGHVCEHTYTDGVCTACGYVCPHNFENGFCTLCKQYEPANLNAQGAYEISNAGQLYWFADKVNSGNTDMDAVLTADIVVNEGELSADATDARVWTPIGNDTAKYSGIFDGQGHTVSGLFFDDTEANYVGMFGYISSYSTVKNTGVINSYFKGNNLVGILAGQSEGTLFGCYSEGVADGVWYVGGLAGGNAGFVEKCRNAGDVSGERYVGGLVGTSSGGIIHSSYNTGTVNSTRNAGGLVGSILNATVNNCYYLDTAYSSGINGSDVEACAQAKTAAQFESGEVAYLLKDDLTELNWGQVLGTDACPVVGADEVYKVTNCLNQEIYSNNSENLQHEFEKGFCKTCGAMDGIALVGGYTISLGGNIAVNYYMLLSDQVLADEDAGMVFTVDETGSAYTVEVPVSQATVSGDYYVFTCEVAAREMTSVISAQIVMSDGTESDVFEYTVKDYAEYILANPQVYAKEQDLVKSMLNYGAYAQIYFDYNTDDLANDTEYMTEADRTLTETLDLSGYGEIITGDDPEVSYYGSALCLESETAFKLYFVVEDGAELPDATVNGKEAELVKNGNLYELKVSDIPAHKLSDIYEVKVGGLTIDFGVFSYGHKAMAGTKDTLKNVVKSMYAYNQSAVDYRG